MRHGEPRAVELCRQAHLEAAVPVLRVDLLDAPGRPRDAGVVHQHVEPAERLQPLVEEAGCVGSVRHFARRVRQVGIARGQAVERRSIEARRAGLLGVISLALGTILPFIVGGLVAAAFGYTDAISITTIGAGAITCIPWAR